MEHGDRVRARHNIRTRNSSVYRGDTGTIVGVDHDGWTGRKTYEVEFCKTTLGHLSEKDVEPAPDGDQLDQLHTAPEDPPL